MRSDLILRMFYFYRVGYSIDLSKPVWDIHFVFQLASESYRVGYFIICVYSGEKISNYVVFNAYRNLLHVGMLPDNQMVSFLLC